VHTKKPVKAHDLYKGRRLEAQEKRQEAHKKAVQKATAHLQGKAMRINPKILTAITKQKGGK
jgi:hypothetical protein